MIEPATLEPTRTNGTSEIEPQVTEEMIKAYQEREAQRAQECAQKIQAILEEYDMVIVPETTIRIGKK